MADDDEPQFKLLADRVKSRRQELGISSGSELGRRAGVEQSLISRIESGRRLPSWNDLAKIASALDLPEEELQLLVDVDDLGLDRVSKLVEYLTGSGIGNSAIAVMEAAKRLSPFYQSVALAILESGLPDAPWSAGDPRDKKALGERFLARAAELKKQVCRLEAEAQVLFDEVKIEESRGASAASRNRQSGARPQGKGHGSREAGRDRDAGNSFDTGSGRNEMGSRSRDAGTSSTTQAATATTWAAEAVMQAEAARQAAATILAAATTRRTRK